jgi:hypothetical protein
MEGDPSTAYALRTTIGLASASELDVVVLHIDDKASLPAFEDQRQHETQAWAAEFLARYVPIPPEAVRLELRVGVAADQVLALASEIGADLIALAWSQDLAGPRTGPGEGRAAGDRAQPDPRAAAPHRRAPGPSGLTPTS